MCPFLYFASPTLSAQNMDPTPTRVAATRQEWSDMCEDPGQYAKDGGGERKTLVCDVCSSRRLASELVIRKKKPSFV